MKRMTLAIFVIAASLVGCGKQDSPPSLPTGQRQMNLPPAPKLLPAVEAANQRYKALPQPVTRPEALRLLGSPKATNASGALVWETTEQQQTVRLSLTFDAQGKQTERSLQVLYDNTAPPL